MNDYVVKIFVILSFDEWVIRIDWIFKSVVFVFKYFLVLICCNSWLVIKVIKVVVFIWSEVE